MHVLLKITSYIFFKGCSNAHAVNTTFGYLDWFHNSGFVRSPGYPSSYPSNLHCRWTIRVLYGYRIRVTVLKADIAGADNGGLGDLLQVDDGKASKNSRDFPAPWDFLSSEHLVRVLFTSDGSYSGEGFYLEYERGIYIANNTLYSYSQGTKTDLQ